MNYRNADASVKRILIYRLGSIGDFVIALPCLHAIRKRYLKAEISLLTNLPIDRRAPPAANILDNTQLIDKYFFYSARSFEVSRILEIRKQIIHYAPDIIVYLAEPRGLFSIYRDFAFFRSCGVSKILGLPLSRDLQACLPVDGSRLLVEMESRRLARCLASSVGQINTNDPANWNLHISGAEDQEAEQILHEKLVHQLRGQPLLGICIGTKQPINDWGINNWQTVLEGLQPLAFGLVLLGASEDWEPSSQIEKCWKMPTLNLCGLLTPRVSAAVMRRLTLLLCHDSGPMHLSAAVGTRCVAVFSRKNPAGKWFPFGSGHKVFYPPSEADTIQAISPHQVIAAVKQMLGNNADPYSAPGRKFVDA